jgi:hypothetical protein
MKDKTTDQVAFILSIIVIALLIAFTSYISFCVGEKYGIEITERKYQPKKD